MFPCAILCGGLAARLRPVTNNIPKSLIAINGEPFISHQLRLLHANGIQRVVLCAGYLGEMIQNFVGDGLDFGIDISYSFDGPEPLGTAGAIRKAMSMLGNSFFVLYGDSYLPCDYGAVASAFNISGTRGLMTIYRNEDNFDSSNVEAADGRIMRYDKRNRTTAMKYIDYGLSVFQSFAFQPLSPNQPADLEQIYQDLLAEGQLAACEITQRFYEIGSAQGIEDFKIYLTKGASAHET